MIFPSLEGYMLKKPQILLAKKIRPLGKVSAR